MKPRRPPVGSVVGALLGGDATMPTGAEALAAHGALLDAARELTRARRRQARAKRPSDATLQLAVDALALVALAFSFAEARHVRAMVAYHRRLARETRKPTRKDP